MSNSEYITCHTPCLSHWHIISPASWLLMALSAAPIRMLAGLSLLLLHQARAQQHPHVSFSPRNAADSHFYGAHLPQFMVLIFRNLWCSSSALSFS
eukprot:6194013-Pleurochrysis_carterae.AAC.1